MLKVNMENIWHLFIVSFVSGFPNVVGAVDGTFIQIIAPKENEPDFLNRKGFHSINVQVNNLASFVKKSTNYNSGWIWGKYSLFIFHLLTANPIHVYTMKLNYRQINHGLRKWSWKMVKNSIGYEEPIYNNTWWYGNDNFRAIICQ